MRIAFVTPFLPRAGADHAGGEYVWRYILELVKHGHRVSVVLPEAEVPSMTGPLEYDVISYNDGQKSSRPRRAIRVFRTGFNRARSIDLNENVEAAEALQAADVIDLQFTQSLLLATQLRQHWPGKVIVCTAHDVAVQSNRRAQSSERFSVRWRARLTAVQVRIVERAALNACDKIFIFNPQNESLLRDIGVTAPISTTPPWIDLPPVGITRQVHAGRVIFPAAFWRQENDESAQWLLRLVWPIVHLNNPGATLWLAGSGPSSNVRSQEGTLGVHVTGYVPDLNEILATAHVMVAPLVRGAGLKFKVLQAMALGVPVVGTSIAAEGIDDVLTTTPMIIEDDPTAFAAAVQKCLTAPIESERMAARAASLVRARLDFSRMIEKQLKGYQALLEPVHHS